MSATAFNPDARTPEELGKNLNFLAVESARWVELVEAMPEDPGVMDAAQATTEKLASQATLLVIRLRQIALARAMRKICREEFPQKVTEKAEVAAC